MRRTEAGFTLIELLIAMILMLIILAAIAFVFAQTTETVNISEARIEVYDRARKAIDTLETDLLGCLPFNGAQRFILDNGYSSTGGAITYGSTGSWDPHIGNAADRLIFRSVTSVGDTIQQVEVTYELLPYGDPTKKQGYRTNRPLYVLTRKLRGPNPTTANVYDQPVKTSAGVTIPDEELCHFVLSFNIEYFANNGRFSQLDPSPCPAGDPLGDGLGTNDTGANPYRIPYIRVTVVIVDDVGERQERVIPRVIWIPMG